MAEEEFVPGLSIPDEDCKTVAFHRKATRKSVLKAVKIRPEVPKIILDSLKERNELSTEDIIVYIAEKYGVYVKMLKNCISTFLMKAEETGLIEKSDMEKFRIKDAEKVENYLEDFVSKKEELELMKDVPVQKLHRRQGRRSQKKMYKKKTKDEDSEKHNSRTKSKTNTTKNMTEISKINQLEDESTAEKELLAITSSAQEINSNVIIEQSDTKAVDIRPLIQNMVFESLKTYAEKYNGASMENINGKNNEIDIKIVKSGINKFLRKGVKYGIFEKVIGANAEERFKFKTLGENEKSKQDLIESHPVQKHQKATRRNRKRAVKEKAVSMKMVLVQKRPRRMRRKTYWKKAKTEDQGSGECNWKTDCKENIIKVTAEISKIVNSSNMSMAEERSVAGNLSIAVESHPVQKHQKATRKNVKRAVAVRSQVPKTVLETLILKEGNALSLDEICVYIAEKYRVYVKILKNHISTFLTEAEETGLVEKVVGANVEEKFKIMDVEKAQKYIQDVISKKQESKLTKDVPVQKKEKRRLRRKGKWNRTKMTENHGEDGEKYNAKVNGKENPNNTKQNAAEKNVIKTVETRPLLQKMILESFKALKKSNGVSVEQIICYIDEKYKFNVKKSQLNKFLRRGVKHGAFEKVDGPNAEEIFKMKKAGKDDTCERNLVSRKRKDLCPRDKRRMYHTPKINV